MVTREQLYEIGLSDRTIARRVAGGEWLAEGRRVLVHHLAPSDAVTRALVVGHHAGASGVLTGFSAVAVQGWTGARPWDALTDSDRPWVIADSHLHLPGARVIRTELPPCNHVMGVQVAHRDQIMIDLLRHLPEAEVKSFGYRVLQSAPPAQLQEILDEAVNAYAHRPGVARLRWLLEATSVDLHSDGEQRLAELLRRAGIGGWRANVSIRLGGATYRPDFYFPESGVVLEVDGRTWHGANRVDADDSRQNAMTAAGLRLIRFSWWRIVNEPEAVVREIRAALGIQV